MNIIQTLQREGWTVNQEADGYHLVEPRREESFFCQTVEEVRRYFGGRRYRQSRGWLPRNPLCPRHGDARDTSVKIPGGECNCG